MPNNNEGQRDTQFVTDSPSTAIVRTVHMSRTVKYFLVQESELSVIAAFNWITGLFGSIGLGLVTFVAGLVIDLAIDGPDDERSITMAWVISAVCVVLSLICFGVAYWGWCKRDGAVEELKKSSEAI